MARRSFLAEREGYGTRHTRVTVGEGNREYEEEGPLMPEERRNKDRALKKEYRVHFDEAGHITGASLHDSLARQLGVALEPCVKRNIFDYLGDTAALEEDLPARLRPHIENLIRDRNEFTIRGDFEARGEELHLHISGRVIRRCDGTNVFTLLFLDDTEHTHLRRLYEYMFRLANHELKSPLACILGATEFAGEHIDANRFDGVKTCLDMIHRNAVVMEEMILRYLTLSKIESGLISIKPSDIKVSEDVLAPILAELRPALMAKSMEVSFAVAGGKHEPDILADPQMLGIVLRNLLSNAVKYGTPGTAIRVHLRAAHGDVEIRVDNEGPGMSDTELERLFKKFVRLESAQGAKGAGLGLYNARRIVESWKGTISARSSEGHAVFAFTIPQ